MFACFQHNYGWSHASPRNRTLLRWCFCFDFRQDPVFRLCTCTNLVSHFIPTHVLFQSTPRNCFKHFRVAQDSHGTWLRFVWLWGLVNFVLLENFSCELEKLRHRTAVFFASMDPTSYVVFLVTSLPWMHGLRTDWVWNFKPDAVWQMWWTGTSHFGLELCNFFHWDIAKSSKKSIFQLLFNYNFTKKAATKTKNITKSWKIKFSSTF